MRNQLAVRTANSQLLLRGVGSTCSSKEHCECTMQKIEKYIKALAGPNPREEGIAPDVLKDQLRARMQKTTMYMGAGGAVALLIIASATGMFG